MRLKFVLISFALLFILLLSLYAGVVTVAVGDIARIVAYRALGLGSIDRLRPMDISIIWEIRLPRILMAFIVGAALSVSGAILQSLLSNPLASAFTLGVSSGASLGASIFIMLGLSGALLLPVMGFGFAMGALFLTMAFARLSSYKMDNATVILGGMVLSVFLNAILTLIISLNRESLNRLIFWQLGSFAGQGYNELLILAPIALVGIGLALCFHRELDIMTFGEDTAITLGLKSRGVKAALLTISGVLAGASISFVGIVAFIDLIAPHMVRRLVGERHILVIPLSALLGGGFMVLADTAARSISPPIEIPIGVITALLGGPFFAYIYLRRKKDA